MSWHGRFNQSRMPCVSFAAGRVLRTPDHGRRLFATLKDKADFGQVLNNNWLRMLVYVLYQRPAILREVPREHVLAAARLCLDVFEQQVQQGNIRMLFMNSLRAVGAAAPGQTPCAGP